ncbi:MAG TPA: 2OG-Fe(II) oxygenase [Azospirillaceae bacterium]|nr:2OG-Fe(II) oxygenase [Azospirillaceae bacterium]
MSLTIPDRLAALDWPFLTEGLCDRGFALTPPLLEPAECAALAALYGQDALFRTTVVMERHGFGLGEYRYFADPLPEPVGLLREAAYPYLAPLARAWAPLLGIEHPIPDTLPEFLEVCRAAGQGRPTPLLLRYGEDGFNCLHQDLYGGIVFPFQMAFLLDRPGIDFEGGEFLLLEQRPRQQSRAEAVPLEQGRAVIFTTRHRPVQGSRGTYRATLKHGVGRIRRGRRHTLGIIFHDAA